MLVCSKTKKKKGLTKSKSFASSVVSMLNKSSGDDVVDEYVSCRAGLMV